MRSVTLNASENATRSKYQMINRILAARKLDKEKEVAENLKEYLRQEQYVKYLFRLEEEE
jgi:L-asparaginase II